jgi:hypothetical protein
MVSSIPSEEDIYFLVLAVVVIAAFTCDINLLLNGTKNHIIFGSQPDGPGSTNPNPNLDSIYVFTIFNATRGNIAKSETYFSGVSTDLLKRIER